jgi:hypothetical protein
MSARYAVYLAPAPDSALWRFGSRVVGRDAATGEEMEGYAPEGYAQEAWREIAAEPRRYGFHATLKAPLRLAEGRSVEAFEQAICALAADIAAFDLGALRVTVLTPGGGDVGFVALTPAVRSTELAVLEARALRELDAFRAPAMEAEIARRRPERLTPRQRGYLETYGYPYVLEEFRLHFTLSGAVRGPERLAEKLATDFAREVPDPSLRVDALALFEQPAGGEFAIRRRFGFS